MGETNGGMSANLRFYMQHAAKINELCHLQSEALSFVAESVAEHLNESGWEWQRSYGGYVSLQYATNANFRGYFYFDELFDKRRFRFALWVVEETMEAWKRLPVESITALETKYANRIDIKNKRQGKAWIQIAKRTYRGIEQDNIENFGAYADFVLANQLKPLLDDVTMLCAKKKSLWYLSNQTSQYNIQTATHLMFKPSNWLLISMNGIIRSMGVDLYLREHTGPEAQYSSHGKDLLIDAESAICVGTAILAQWGFDFAKGTVLHRYVLCTGHEPDDG